MSKTVLFNTFAIEDMQMRDYYAAKAMQALIEVVQFRGYIREERLQEAVKTAWHIADLMLEARNK